MKSYINLWTSKDRVLGSTRDGTGKLVVQTVGPARYTGYVHTGTKIDPSVYRERVPNYPGWDELLFSDYESRKAALERYGQVLFEADINPVRRLISDLDIGIAPPRRAFLDIETDSRVPPREQAETGRGRILCWSIVDTNHTVYSGMLEDEDDQAETDMLVELWRVMAQYDQIAAWNGDGFDYPVIDFRSQKLLGPIPRGKVFWENRRRLLLVDHMSLFKRHHMAPESGDEKTSLKLNDVCQSLLGEGKNDFDARRTWEAWAEGGARRKEMLAYCIQDTALLPKLDEITGYFDLQQTLAEVTYTPSNSHGLKPMPQVDGYLLRKARLAKTHLPSKKPPTGNEKQYEGAFVMPPNKIGVHRTVHVCDFKSLYPTLIRTFNMSPETKDEFGCIAYGTGVSFGTEQEGMLAGACREFMEQREVWKKKAKADPNDKYAERMNKAFKIANNSIYGVVGSVFSRFYDPQIVESVTLGGQAFMKATIAHAQSKGYHTVYGDSVTGDRTVVARDPLDNVRIIPFSELWSLAAPEVAGDEKEYGSLTGWKALTEKGWRDIRAIMRHKTEKPVFLVTTKHGQTRVTEDHGIMCDTVPTRPEEFTRFTKVSVPKENPPERIDLFEYVKFFSISNPYKGRTVTRRFIADSDWIYLDGWGDPHEVKIRRYCRTDSPEYLSLVRLITCYVADGSASLRGKTTSRFMLSFCKSDLEWMNLIAEDLATLGIGFKVTGPLWTDTVYVVRSGTAALSCLFAALCGYKSRDKKLPPFMFKLTNDAHEVYIDTLKKTDGDVDGKQFRYTTNSQQLAAGTSYILAQCGLPHSFSYRESKTAYTIRTRPWGSERTRCKVKIVKESHDDYVYDLTVEGAHTFVDGIGQVLLHNTDSCFVMGCDVQQFKAFVDECNTVVFPKMFREQGCEPRFTCVELDYEKAFDRLVFPLGQDGECSAKRYFGSYLHYAFNPKTKPEIRGLEYMRGDGVKLARRCQKELIDKILAGAGADELEMWILSLRQQIMTEFLPLEDIQLQKGIGQELDAYKAAPGHVKLARELLEAGEDIGQGSRIAYVITDGTTSPATIIAAQHYDGSFDRHHLWMKQLYPCLLRILAGAFPDRNWRRHVGKRPVKPLPGQLSLLA